MLSRKMREATVNVWLVNTGWSGGPYGTGKRISLNYTRALIAAALEGELEKAHYRNHEIFGLAMPDRCKGIPENILDPKNTWSDKEAYDHKANFLAQAFLKNFEKFAGFANDEILSGAPEVHIEV
jgi:phosphoenolpyruvate carboxykinase (ATP)